jgi:hypothetical protein
VFFRNNPISSKELNAGVDLGRYPVTVTVVVPEALIVLGDVVEAYANGTVAHVSGAGSFNIRNVPDTWAYETMPIKSPLNKLKLIILRNVSHRVYVYMLIKLYTVASF